MSRQYCRYCAFCFEADDFRCSNHPDGDEPHWTREQINRPNTCPNFQLSDLGDVENGRPYTPRENRPRKKADDDAAQISIWDKAEAMLNGIE